MEDKYSLRGKHYAKQPIMKHKELVSALSARTGVSQEDVDKVLISLPILIQDCFQDFVGVKIKGLATFRSRLIPGRPATFQGSTPRTEMMVHTISQDRVVPDVCFEREFTKVCKSLHHFMEQEAFKELAPDKLKKALLVRIENLNIQNPYESYAQQENKKAFKEDISEDVERRISVTLKNPTVEETSRQ